MAPTTFTRPAALTAAKRGKIAFGDERLTCEPDYDVGVFGVSQCGVTCGGSVRTSPTKHRELGGTLPPRVETLEDDVAIGQFENVGAVVKPLR